MSYIKNKSMKKSKLMHIPLYLRDKDSGDFAQVIEQNGDEVFAYYIDLSRGRYSASIGSISVNLKNDLDCVEVLTPEVCEKLHSKLHMIRQRNVKEALALSRKSK